MSNSTIEGPYMVLVLGRPASGKSTVSATIAKQWQLPIVAKDALKEILFDHLGYTDRARSRTLGSATFALLDHVVELQLSTRAPFLIDAAYNAEFEDAKYQAWQRRYGFTAVQVHCTVPVHELERRFAARAQDGTRHPGHADHEALEEFRHSLTDGRRETLDLRGPIIEYNSAETDAAHLIERLVALLPPAQSANSSEPCRPAETLRTTRSIEGSSVRLR